MKKLVLAFGILAGTAIGGGYAAWPEKPPLKEIPWGWYERADSRAVGNRMTALNMSIGETGIHCMCSGGKDSTFEHSGFFVQDQSDGTFVVVKAPEGYPDTIGRLFKWKPAD